MQKIFLCNLRSYYLQTWHRISWLILHTPANFYSPSSKKLSPSSIYNFEKQNIWDFKTHLHLLTNSNQLQHWICFLFKIGFFFQNWTRKKITILILILLGVLNILKFRIKRRKHWYSVKHSFENFVLFYLTFSAQFFVDVKKLLY